MGTGYWMINTWQIGNIGEKTKSWRTGNPTKRNSKASRSSAAKQKNNEDNVVRRVNRLTIANFSEGDLFLGLDYGPERYALMTERANALMELTGKCFEDCMRQEANRELGNYLKRVKRALPEGVELKYIAVTSDMDGDTGEMVRIHHHIIVNKEAWTAAVEKWGIGGTYSEALRKQDDRTALCEYLMNQVRRLPEEKKYRPSRNLVHPKPKSRVVWSGAEVKPPRGAQLLYRTPYYGERSGQYIRYVIPTKTE